MKKRSESLTLRFFKWKIYPHHGSGVLWADGRSGNSGVRLGRYSLGSSDREIAVAKLQDLDAKMAVRTGRAGRDVLRPGVEPTVSLEAGRTAFEQYSTRPEITGGVSPKTAKRYRSVLKKFIKFADSRGVRSWNDVDRRLLDAYAGWLDENNYAYATVYQELTVVIQAVNCLIDKLDLLPESRRVRMKLVMPVDTTTYCYTLAEVTAMIAHCQSRPELHWLGRIIVILSHTGMRIGELMAARWDDIDQEPDLWTIPYEGRRGTLADRQKGRTTKGRKTRHVPITDAVRIALDELARHQHADGFIARAEKGGRLDDERLREALVRDVLAPLSERFPARQNEKGLIDGRLHSFRHYFCSVCANGSVPERMLSAWLGHAGGRMMRRYYHLKNDQSLLLSKGLKFAG